MGTKTADYVIAGGGSAGCVLASRLSENPNCSVILLEAGGPGDGFLVKMPSGSYKLLGKPTADWMYMTEPDPSLNGRRVMWTAGKMLGGGSSINGMMYIRGSRADYDSWEKDLGCTGWGWNNVQTYFKRSEGFDGAPSQSHSTEGPLGVALPRKVHPLSHAFVDACADLGMRKVDDYCAGDVDGAFIAYVTQRNGQRSSAALAFLQPAMKRPNLTVITGALVDKVLIENGQATGVQYVKDGIVHQVAARREVIISASTMASPAILLRSGIGPAEELRKMGIAVQVDSPEVGKNLQEHASVQTSVSVDIPTVNMTMGPLHLAKGVIQYLLAGRGIMSMTPVEGMAFLRSEPGLAEPDIKLQFGAFSFDPATRKPYHKPGIVVYTNVAKPRSRGEIRLRSADPADAPVIDHRLLGDPQDMAALVRGLKAVDDILHAPSFAKHMTGRIAPAERPRDDAEWEARIRNTSGIGYHPVGTCRMGGDDRSVVDPRLRVRGVKGLRVADGSIMPIMPSANTNAPAIMVGEKAADLIREDAA
ncbi:GMC family oxidoreductase N-terminal domain-containing protein [Novosphingobium sp. MMS21-SN21R]|uniref:GMC family oxidoreductase n=1 Tax=Novosphingobium sp. MMS21-SN21R TaxID=2969298 RepID=UPI00288775AD|nr:GMC family oxidoreductase N-terminal domain-containing protein [Novosphingobium sp. MMS21-SN21R]MDT0509838.1 GMC family oxidoreductase N-terminal domain-containing protein [Novosphingobium sp. MMS21-SN21R]